MNETTLTHLLAYINQRYGWKVTKKDVLGKREYNDEQGDRLVVVLDRGIKGCPKITTKSADLGLWLDEVEKVQETRPVAVSVFTQIPGVTEAIQEALYKRQIFTYDDLRFRVEDDPDSLLEISGIGPAKLQKVKDYLKDD